MEEKILAAEERQVSLETELFRAPSDRGRRGEIACSMPPPHARPSKHRFHALGR